MHVPVPARATENQYNNKSSDANSGSELAGQLYYPDLYNADNDTGSGSGSGTPSESTLMSDNDYDENERWKTIIFTSYFVLLKHL